jgi:hypothetical protein
MQMIMLMDRLTKQVNMDLKLTPYVILATSPEDGYAQPSHAHTCIYHSLFAHPQLPHTHTYTHTASWSS